MSTFSTRVRDAWAPFGKAYAYSKTLPGGTEQALGCDTLIIIYDDIGAKICLLEAKWPRVATKPAHKWDSLQKLKSKTGHTSHFSSQLSRQRLVLPEVFVAEMFLLESSPGTKSVLLDEFGSTLVPHSTASAFDAKYRTPTRAWSNKDFWELMAFSRKKKLNLEELMFGLASCKIGTPIPISAGIVTLSTSGLEKTLKIPVTVERLSQMGPEVCEQLGISTLISLDIGWLGWR